MRELTLNRPVHIAGRDACYSQAIQLLQSDLMNCEVSDRLEKCRTLTTVVQSAKEQADFAMRGIEACREEQLFVRFLDLLLDSAQALLVMTKHEHLLASDREMLRELLGANAELVDRSAAEHRQLAQSLLRETTQLIQMADETFRKLQENDLAEFGKNDSLARYQRAFDSFQRPRK